MFGVIYTHLLYMFSREVSELGLLAATLQSLDEDFMPEIHSTLQ
jgi:hypothetical protein